MDLATTLITLAFILFAAKVGGALAARVKQPEVLGELFAGIVIGNLSLIGINQFGFIAHDHFIEIIAEIGIIVLLFEVGLETNLKEMRAVGVSALLVAIIGIVCPFALGWLVSGYFLPEEGRLVHAYIGAVLTATSVGITARVLKELNKVQSSEGKIILGAAVIDDVLGLLVLSVMTAIIAAANAGGTFEFSSLAKPLGFSFGFLFVSVAIGGFLMPKWFRFGVYLRTHQTLLPLALIFCFGMAFLASRAGLAPIIGAFVAGLVLEPSHYEGVSSREKSLCLEHLIQPIATLCLPVFFVLMGAKVDLNVFADLSVVSFALFLSLAAILGKQLCSLGALEKGVDRLAIGFGMIPRGEVGLIFAGIGAALTVAGDPVIDTATYGAVVIMVMVTTLVTPPLLKWRFGRSA